MVWCTGQRTKRLVGVHFLQVIWGCTCVQIIILHEQNLFKIFLSQQADRFRGKTAQLINYLISQTTLGDLEMWIY